MESWLAAPTARRSDDKQKKRSQLARYSPYSKSKASPTLRTDHNKPSSAAITKRLLDTLSDESNPITHSDIYERSDHVVSLASGHQRSERRSGVRTGYLQDRTSKLTEQREDRTPEAMVLVGVRVYINGYLSDTTDIEMKRTVTQAGGEIVRTASGATHIVTSHDSLNASTTHKFLTTKSKNKVYVVKPEWATESIKAGKRQPERDYAVIKDMTTKNVFASFKKL
ncbi:hypothetical protein PILCRDRAFT_811437 [Piloderma croceum F 1598]|uniref:BRCT domain-containing protein n=1 Tax=Piloderma croceum (strain F 1598) TaxID=765440 RepID=A0A0C3GH11_PILCF|nr:hypothetical protein PILCRDRAFT_811437 [Piloderma croceum F 1598]